MSGTVSPSSRPRFLPQPDAHGLNLELVIVDDNSPDGTGPLADSLAQTFNMRVIHRSGKLGLGTAVVAGFAEARAEVLGVRRRFQPSASAGSANARDVEGMQADVVVASRDVPGGSTPNWPLRRRLLSRAACLLARPITPIRDAASGFFLIRREIARRVTIKAGGFKICLELLVRGRPNRLVELPYQFEDRELGESKMSSKEAAGYLVQLRDLYWVRWTSPGQRKVEYHRLSAGGADAMLHSMPPLHTPVKPGR